MIRVLVADDQAAVRGGFTALINAQPHMLVVGEAEDGRQAVDLALDTSPDVVLMDVRMPRLDGLQATRIICGHPTLGRARVLVLTTFDSTTTSTRRCAPARAASCSKTPAPKSCWMRSRWSPPATR